MLHFIGFHDFRFVVECLLGQNGDGAGGDPGPGGPGSFLGGPLSFPIVIAIMFMVFYFLMIRPERKRAQAHEAMIKSLKKGDTVLTASGIIGKIHRLDDKDVILYVDKDSNVKMRFRRHVISEVIGGEKSADKASSAANSK